MNKKKKLNILLSCIAIVILAGFTGIMVVSSLGVGFNGLPGGKGGAAGGCEAPNAWCYNYGGLGVRLSIVDKNGKRLGTTSYDLVGKPGPINNSSGQDWREIYMLPGQKMRQEVSGEVDFQSTGYKGITGLKSILSSGDEGKKGEYVAGGSSSNWWGKIATMFDCDSVDAAKKFSKADTYKTAMFNYLDKIKDTDQVYDDLDKLFGAMGYSVSSRELSKEEIENIYIQIEPLLITSISKFSYKDDGVTKKWTGLAFYGTITETAYHNFAYQAAIGLTLSGGGESPGIYLSEAEAGFTAGSNSNDRGLLTNTSVGNGVGLIKLSDFLTNDGNCEDLLKIIHENPTRYKVGEDSYDDAITAIREGNKNVKIIDKDGKEHTVDKAYNNEKENFWMFKENYDQREKMGKKAQCGVNKAPCGSAVNFLNNNWHETAKVGTDAYDTAILKIIDGTWFYYADNPIEDYWIMDKPYPVETYQGLKKEVYDENGGKASCGPNKDCTAAVKYIQENYSGEEYHTKISLVKEGRFKEGGYEISEPQNFYYLIREHYVNENGGVAKCEDNTPPPPVCGKPADVYRDNCVTGKSWFKDNASEDMWLKCETAFGKDGTSYASENTGHIATEDSLTINKIVGNREYCPVFCHEEVETDFPTEVFNVRAGQTFFWGNNKEEGIFGTIKIKKVCKTQEQTDGGKSGDGYLYKKWENDYVTNEMQRTSNWMQKGAVEQLIERCSPPYNCVSVYSYCPVPLVSYSCGTAEHPSTCWYCPVAYKYGYSPSASQSHSQATEWKMPLDPYNTPRIANSYSPTSSGSGYLTPDAARQAGHAAVMSELYSKQSELIGKDTSYKRREADLIEKIRQCLSRMKYVYDTTVDFVFKEPQSDRYDTKVNRKYYAQEQYQDLLLMEPNDADIINQNGSTPGFTNTRGGKNCHKEEIWLYKCIGTKLDSKCVKESSIWVDYCDQLEWNIEGTWTYKYKQEDFMWFSLKYNTKRRDATLMNTREREEEYSEEDENLFYSIGFGLPTALSLPAGKYGTNADSPMKVIVSKLGDTGGNKEYDIDPAYTGEKNYHTGDGHFKNLLDSVLTTGGSSYGFEYTCTYEVKNDIFGTECKYDEFGNLLLNSPHYCDPSEDNTPSGRVLGVDVAYRLVSLLQEDDSIAKAFPGREGNGRTMGYNWILGEDEIKNILRTDVYDDKAMYEIFLDVALIRRIREDNKTVVNGDAYTAFAKEDNVICTTGNDKYCATQFISDLAIDGYLVGTCLGELDTQTRANNHGVCDNKSYDPLDIDWVR